MFSEFNNTPTEFDPNFDSLLTLLNYEAWNVSEDEENNPPLFGAGLFSTNQSIEQIRAAFQHIDEEGFIDATQVLIRLDVDPVPLLLDAIEIVDDEKTFQHIARALSELGESAVIPLLDRFKSESNFVTQGVSASALGRIKDKRAVEPLIAALGEQKWWINHDAIWALGELQDKRAVETLIQMLDKDNPAALIIVEALEKLGDEKAVPKLLQLQAQLKEHYDYSPLSFEFDADYYKLKETVDLVIEQLERQIEKS